MIDGQRARVFGLTWLSYAGYYLTRKNFAVAKGTLERTFGIDRGALANIETGYHAAYAGGQLLWGLVGDRVGTRRLLVAGMLATAACSVGFGCSSTAIAFAVLFAANGLAQSTGWPANVKAMAQWFPPERRGSVMGIWSTCYQIGSLVATPLAVFFLSRSSWRGAFFGPAALVATIGLAQLFLPRRPRAAPLTVAAARADRDTLRAARRAVLRHPTVWMLGASYFFLKLTRYALLNWLVYFMEAKDGLGYATARAAWVSLAFEGGGTVGSIAVGAVSDRWLGGRRLGISIACLVALAGALPLYGFAAHHGVLANVAALALVGFFLYGPDTLLSGAAAQDLGGPSAAATAAGMVNGLGSLGQIASGQLTAMVSKRAGWGALFALLGVGALCSSLILIIGRRWRPENRVDTGRVAAP